MTMDEIKQAIHNKKLISFVYNGQERIAEPHIVGTIQGKGATRCYQVGGHSSTGQMGWKTMYLESVSSLKILEESFPGKRDTPSHKDDFDPSATYVS